MDSTRDRNKYEPVMRKDSKTGKIYFTNKDGTIKYRTVQRTTSSTNMAEAQDARSLIGSTHQMEKIYADYANSMKALANRARIEMINTPNIKMNKNASKIYAKEVSSLEAKLNTAKVNSIRERQARRQTEAEINKRKEVNPDLKGEDERKLAQRYLDKNRKILGAIPRRKRDIKIEPREWEAIQAGAISNNKLVQILNNSDTDKLRELALPKDRKTLNQSQINRVLAMANRNFTLQQIADKMGVSTSTISKILKGER